MAGELDPNAPLGNQSPVSEDAAYAAQSAARYSNRGPVASGEQAAEGHDWFSLKDTVEAPLRGVFGAVHGAASLVDAVAGTSLSKWDNPLGESTTVVGSALEDIFKFSAGFIPFAGVGGFAGLLPELAEGAGALLTIGRTALAAGLTGATVYEGHQKRVFDLLDNVPALKGPVTDFLKSNPDDSEVVGRLKNAVEQAGMAAAFEPLLMGLKGLWKAGRHLLENPKATAQEVESVIAAETAGIQDTIKTASDTHAINTVDGGSAVDPSVSVAPEVPPSTAEAVAAKLDEQGVPLGSKQAERMEARRQADLAARLANPDVEANRAFLAEAKAKYPDLSDIEAMKAYGAEGPTAVGPSTVPFSPEEAATRAKLASVGIPGEPGYIPPGGVVEKLPVPDVGVAVPKDLEPMVKSMDVLGIPKTDVKALIESMAAKEEAAPQWFTPEGADRGPNPRNMSPMELVDATMESWHSNLSQFLNKDSVPVYLSAMESAYLPAAEREFGLTHDVVGLAQRTQAEFREFANMVGSDETTLWARVFGNIKLDRANLPRIAARTRSYTSLMNITAKTNIAQLGFIDKLEQRLVTGNLDLELVRMDYNSRKFASLQFAVKGLKSDFGRGLQSMGDAPYQGDLQSYLEQAAKQGHASGQPGIPDPIDAVLTQDSQKLKDTVNALGGRDYLLKQAKKMLAVYRASGTEGLAELTRPTVTQKVMAWTKEFFVNNLFGPKTVVINALSQTANHMYLPYEGLFGAKIMQSVHGPAYDPVVNTFARIGRDMATSPARIFKMFGALSKEGALVANDSKSALFDTAAHEPAITAANAGFDAASVEGKMIDTAGKIVRLPSAILGTTDKSVRLVATRSYAESHLYQKALDAGITDPVAQTAFVSERINKLIVNNQIQTLKSTQNRLIDEAIQGGLTDPVQIQMFVDSKLPTAFPEDVQGLAENADAYAREGNFSNQSEPGTIAYSVQRMVAQHPWLGFIAPFISVPDKLLRWTGQRLDGVGLAKYMAVKKFGVAAPALEDIKSRFLRDMLHGSPEEKARAVGRLCTGAGLVATAGSAAASGILIGGGPKDPEARAAWAADGRIPYSIKTPDGYLQFSRLDPVATTFAMAADIHDTYKHLQEEDTPAAQALTLGLGVAMGNLLQKSYLNGIKGFIEAITDPEKNGPAYIRQFAGGFVPFSATARQAEVPLGDPYVRDIRGLIDSLQSRIPGLSDRLPPQRNILGEPVRKTVSPGTEAVHPIMDFWLPIAYQKTSDDTINREIADLGYAFTPPKRTVNGLDLSNVPSGETTAYDRLGELRGTIRLGGLTLRDSLNRLIKSPAYQALTPDPLPNGYLSPRAEQLQRVISRYSNQAWESLKRENPTLRQQDMTFIANKHRLRAGLSILPPLEGQ